MFNRYKTDYKKLYKSSEEEKAKAQNLVDDALFELQEKNYKKVKHLLKRAENHLW